MINSIFYLLAKCIDHYMAMRVKKFEKGLDKGEEIDPRLEAIVNRMFERCLKERQYQHAAGVAFETRRIDILERAISESVCLSFSLSLPPSLSPFLPPLSPSLPPSLSPPLSLPPSFSPSLPLSLHMLSPAMESYHKIL